MNVRIFFDTNILVYFFQNDEKSQIAKELLFAGGAISVQSLNEFVNVARGKLKIDWDNIELGLSAMKALCGEPLPLTAVAQADAVRISRKYGYRIYDAMILATAIDADCDVLFSEDLQDGQTVDGVRIINPFKRSA